MHIIILLSCDMSIPFLALLTFIKWNVYIVLTNFNGKLDSDCIDLIIPAALLPWGVQPITEMSTISWGVKAAGA